MLSRLKDPLNALLLFNGLTAVAGGLFLMANTKTMPLESLQTTAFSSYYLPGVILFALVGGSSIAALLSRLQAFTGHEVLSLLAGIIMLCWILGEIVSIRQFHWLQAIYLVTGVLVVIYALKGTENGRRPSKN